MDQTSLPVHLTRFIGRDRELNELTGLAARSRLLTLTGAGGSGKTRLAEELAARVGASFARVAWVDLAPLADPGLIVQQVGDALAVPQRPSVPGESPLDFLVQYMCEHHVLVVLDNCEHLVDACASLVEALLRGCRRLAIIATSREALGAASETAWLVPPLASTEALQLFVERAQSVLPSFALDASNTAGIQEICRRLDGLPLAIELAAARVRVLTPAQIAERLDQAFRLLTSGSRTSLPRHRTLRATMEWSYALLAPREQVLLRRLSVFVGHFTLDAVERVAAGAPLDSEDLLDGVAALVDKSLVLMEPGDSVARYRLLETVRQYGLERLAESGEREGLERRFAEYFLSMLEASAADLVGGSNLQSLLASLIAEHDNLRAAAVWACADRSRADLALRFVGSLFWYLYAIGLFREARELTDRALAMIDGTEPPLLRGRALVTSGLTALAQGEYPRSQRDFEAALPLLREGGDRDTTAQAMAKYGAALMLGGEIARALKVLDETIEFTRDWPRHDIAVVFATFWRGWAAYGMGQFDVALELFTSIKRAAGPQRLLTSHAHATCALAHIEFARGNIEQACKFMTEGLECEIAIKDGWGVALGLDVAPLVAARRGRHEEAAQLLAGIEAHRARLAMALPGPAAAGRSRLLETLRQTLGPRFDKAYAEGAALSTDELIARAFAEASRNTAEHVAPKPAPAPAISDTRPRLRVQALGPLRVFVGDKPVEASAWGSARPRELLAYLLLHSEGRTKEQVGLAFWPDASTAQLRNSFHVTLHRLRKALGGADWVTLENDRYRIAPELIEEFDAAAFERDLAAARTALKRQQPDGAAKLEAALARFRGDLLDGETVGDWHLEHRDRLQRLYVDALMELGARHIKEGRQAQAAEAYRRVLARDGIHEEALQGLMRCHAALGEKLQALRLFQQFSDRLKAELQTKPRVETVRLFESLR